jgi:hypothetical protein
LRGTEVEEPLEVSQSTSLEEIAHLCVETLQGVQKSRNLSRFQRKKAQEEECLCAQRNSCKECRKLGNLSRFHKSQKLRRDSVFKNTNGSQGIDFVEETKAETFGTWKIFQGK